MSTQQTPPGYAVLWKRAVAFLIDAVVVVSIYSAVIYLVNTLLRLPVEYSFILERGLSLKMTRYVEENFIGIVLLYSLSKLAVLFPYFALMESSRWMGTVGKQAVRIKVTDLAGRRISFGRATGRFFAKILSGQILLIGYLIAAFTRKRQTLHDLLAGTVVVNKKRGVANESA